MISRTDNDSILPLQGPLLCIVGPTAIGKNRAASILSKSLAVEIVNADSRQVYKEVLIGTGSPRQSNIYTPQHHLYNFIPPELNYNLQSFTNDARGVINAIQQKKKLPVLVGGTGQYIWALLENWQIPEVAPDEDFRSHYLNRVNKEGPQAIHAELQKIDQISSSKIHMNNVRRVIRALEVYHATGTPFSSLVRKSKLGNKVLIIGMNAVTTVIQANIERRIESMFKDGWLDEVKNLFSKYPDLSLNFYSSIGYLEIIDYLAGNISFEETLTKIQKKTISFAKKQYNWFSLHDSRIHWTSELPFTSLDTSWDLINSYFPQYKINH